MGILPQEKFWPPHHQITHAPSLLPFLPHLLEFSLRIQCWCDLEHVRLATQRRTDAMIGGGAQTFPTVCRLAHKFPLQGVKTF